MQYESINGRNPEYEIDPIFLKRWSPRAMSGEEITHEELMSLFEAAKWAPSSYNNQSWRFVYAKRNTKYWNKFFDLLTESNKTWAKNAAVLVIILSKNTFDFNAKPTRTHSFDTGAAWENLAMQATINGLVAHAMEGFDYQKAKEVLNLPSEYPIEVMVAIGKPAKKDILPHQLKDMEFPSNRKKLSELVFEGEFKQ